ncbi:MAG: polysulfide reductase, partial [Nitrososphaerales archaeon]
IVAVPKTRTINGIIFASVLVVIGMWLERFLIVIPTLTTPLMPYPDGIYIPTWVEWAITAGAFAGFMLAYSLFSKFFPVLSRWEISEGAEESHNER